MPPKGKKTAKACRGMNGSDEACAWRYEIDESKCPETCEKMVAFFAGDSQSCDDHDEMLGAYATAGYIATCISLFETVDASRTLPFGQQGERADASLAAVMASPEIQARWGRGHLLLAGTGHGATVAVTTMARTELDEQGHWKGSLTTGACFYDGSFDVFALEERLQTGAADGGPCSGPMTPAQLEARYAYMPEAKAQDSITGVAATSFTPLHWKLIECGSAMDACESDIAPADPIEQLCTTLSAGSDHLCELDSLPNEDHASCATNEASRCISWFDKIVARP